MMGTITRTQRMLQTETALAKGSRYFTRL